VEVEVPARLNIGVACADAHLGTAAADRVAMIVEDDALGTSSITYRALAQRTSRFAQLLRQLGVGAGERVLIRLPLHRLPTAFLGAMKRGAVSVPPPRSSRRGGRVPRARLRRAGHRHRQGGVEGHGRQAGGQESLRFALLPERAR